MSSFEIVGSAADMIGGVESEAPPAQREEPRISEKRLKEAQKGATEQSQLIIDKLLKYAAHPHFSRYLQHYDLSQKSLMKMAEEDLMELHARVTVSINGGLSDGMTASFVFGGVSLFEMMTKNKLQLEGLTEALKKDEEFALALDQFNIEQGSIINLPPHFRMMMSLFKTIALVRMTNTMNELKKQPDLIAVPVVKVPAAEEPEAERRSPTGFGEGKPKRASQEPSIGVHFD